MVRWSRRHIGDNGPGRSANSEDELVLCLVDDLQWLDVASAEALLFSARRLRAEPVALIFACRDDDVPAQSLAGIDRWQIGGLL